MATVSVVIPCYKSANTIAKVVELTKSEITALGFDYEFVLVNDGSGQETWNAIKDLCLNDREIKGIDFSRNFGQHAALMAAIKNSSGDYILGMDDDLQTHPSQIPLLVNALNDDVDLVYATYEHKKHGLFRNAGSAFYKTTMRFLTGRDTDIQTSSFWAAKAYLRQGIMDYEASNPHVSSLFLSLTNNVTNVKVQHFDREQGTSGYNLKKLVKTWSSCTNYSTKLLGCALPTGLTICALALAAIVVMICMPSLAQQSIPYVALTACLVLGLSIVFDGFLSMYVAKMFSQQNNGGWKKQYVIRDSVNCNQSK